MPEMWKAFDEGERTCFHKQIRKEKEVILN
jgi:hypothetical protein